jgi:hypothetical protein
MTLTCTRSVPWLAIAFATLATAASAQSLPGTKRDLAFDAHLKTVDLEVPNLRFDDKRPTADGSSIGIFIANGAEPTNRSFVPTNPSSIPEA